MRKRVVILGGGPAGLFTALTIKSRLPGLEITVIEKEEFPGGITASFRYRDLTFDYGSHRLHPATSPEILSQIRSILGDDLLKRPRHGRIWLLNRFITFPLKPLELLFRLPVSFSAGIAVDSLMSPFMKKGKTFESNLLKGLGRTISRKFYFPYARKLWGLAPGKLSPVQARKRIASGSIFKMMKKAFSSLFGTERSGGFFYYPREGFGEIAEKAAEKLADEGVAIKYQSDVNSIRSRDGGTAWIVELTDGANVESDFILSTIPVSSLVKFLSPPLPPEVTRAAEALSYRSMVFLYLELKGARYTEYDAHYFPGSDICFSRLSEPGNYSMNHSPADRTGLCFEIPCNRGDNLWNMDISELTGTVLTHLRRTGLPEPEIISSFMRRKETVYPVYDLAFEKNLAAVEKHLETLPGLVSLGRQGLFVHDNTHHTIEMGIAAAACLDSELNWDNSAWEEHRKLFESHVVVD